MTAEPIHRDREAGSVAVPALAILLIALLLRVYFFVGVLGSDDVFHAAGALRLLEDGWFLPVGHHQARIGLWMPIVPLVAWFGSGEWQTALFPLLCGLLVVALAMAIGLELFGRTMALAAGLLAAVFPLDVLYSTTLYPDLPLGALSALAIYLALRAGRSERPALLAALSGLVWGYAYLIKIEAAFLLPAVLGLWLLRYLSFRNMVIVGVCVGAVVAAENLVYYLVTDTLLYRVHNITSGTIKVTREYSATQLWVFPKSWFLTPYQFGVHYYLLFAGMLLALVTRRRPALLLLIWAAAFLLWLQFGGNPLSKTYTVKSHLSRYCSMLSVPAALLGAYFVVEGLGALRRWLAPVALAGSALVALLMLNFSQLAYEAQHATKLALEEVRKNGWLPLYADSNSETAAGFLWWPTSGQPVQEITDAIDKASGVPKVTDAYVLLNWSRLEYRHRRYTEPLPDLAWFDRCAERRLVVDNPMPAIAYAQARLMGEAAAFIPGVGASIKQTADELVRGNDVLVYRVPAELPDGCRIAGAG